MTAEIQYGSFTVQLKRNFVNTGVWSFTIPQYPGPRGFLSSFFFWTWSNSSSIAKEKKENLWAQGNPPVEWRKFLLKTSVRSAAAPKPPMIWNSWESVWVLFEIQSEPRLAATTLLQNLTGSFEKYYFIDSIVMCLLLFNPHTISIMYACQRNTAQRLTTTIWLVKQSRIPAIFIAPSLPPPSLPLYLPPPARQAPGVQVI